MQQLAGNTRRRRSSSQSSSDDCSMPPTRRRRRKSPSSDEQDSDAEGCTNNSSIHAREDSSSATSTDAHLSTAARLAAAGLYHLQSMHLILCTTCKIALGPRHAASHASREHSRTTQGLQVVLSGLELCKPSEAELVALPANTPHLRRASSERSTVPAFIISRRPIRLAPIDQLAVAPASSSSSGDSYDQQRYQIQIPAP